ncbi:hypothetical protein E4U22_000418 [Claviceps purpurea]|nr:hypothetical protein E4U11_003154 [Claviceps purpurea]KAG6313971.1 hypothetical protein E4U22_000418 [Claviceps purpurea]
MEVRRNVKHGATVGFDMPSFFECVALQRPERRRDPKEADRAHIESDSFKKKSGKRLGDYRMRFRTKWNRRYP